tara:strand:- start:67 stop:663 length:597 start_codon:yes stop_codon:yes gene_type:complete
MALITPKINAGTISQTTFINSMPAGHIIQVKHAINAQIITVSASGWTDILTNTMTPLGTNSNFLIRANIATNASDDSDLSGSNAYPLGKFVRSVASGSYSDADNLHSYNVTVPHHFDPAPYRPGSSGGEAGGMRYRTRHSSVLVEDNPTYTLGNTIAYKLQINLNGQADIQIGCPEGYGGDVAYGGMPVQLTVYEIKA